MLSSLQGNTEIQAQVFYAVIQVLHVPFPDHKAHATNYDLWQIEIQTYRQIPRALKRHRHYLNGIQMPLTE